MELDTGYYTLETLYARRENFKVAFDKTNKVEEIMKNTWLEMKEKNKGTTAEVNMNEIISYIGNIDFYKNFIEQNK